MAKDVKNLDIYIAVVGAGGTGSSFMELLTKYLSTANRVNELRIKGLYMYDGDRVEEKNLQNQAYIAEDVGLKKVEVLSDIYSQYVPKDVKWHFYDGFLQKKEDLMEPIEGARQKVYSNGEKLLVLIGCVDNHNARLILEDIFYDKRYPNVFLYDSANSYLNGEVVFAHKLGAKIYSPPRSVIFPDIKKGDLRNVTEMSCEELNNSEPQHLLVNRMAAITLMNGLTSFLERCKPKTGYYLFDNEEGTCDYFDSTHLLKRGGRTNGKKKTARRTKSA